MGARKENLELAKKEREWGLRSNLIGISYRRPDDAPDPPPSLPLEEMVDGVILTDSDGNIRVIDKGDPEWETAVERGLLDK